MSTRICVIEGSAPLGWEVYYSLNKFSISKTLHFILKCDLESVLISVVLAA